jgi:hypothetical protein
MRQLLQMVRLLFPFVSLRCDIKPQMPRNGVQAAIWSRTLHDDVRAGDSWQTHSQAYATFLDLQNATVQPVQLTPAVRHNPLIDFHRYTGGLRLSSDGYWAVRICEVYCGQQICLMYRHQTHACICLQRSRAGPSHT